MRYLRLVGWALLLMGLLATPLFAGHTERVSLAGPARTGNGTSRDPAITADARYVVFDSTAADLAPAAVRATALGFFSMATGLAAFVASFAGGLLWQWRGPSATFFYGAALAAAAAAVLAIRPPARLVK